MIEGDEGTKQNRCLSQVGGGSKYCSAGAKHKTGRRGKR